MAVCSEIHTKHINTVCGQNVELLNVKLAVHIVTTGLYRIKPGQAAYLICSLRCAIYVFVAVLEHLRVGCSPT